jgi:hypothetical protein
LWWRKYSHGKRLKAKTPRKGNNCICSAAQHLQQDWKLLRVHAHAVLSPITARFVKKILLIRFIKVLQLTLFYMKISNIILSLIVFLQIFWKIYSLKYVWKSNVNTKANILKKHIYIKSNYFQYILKYVNLQAYLKVELKIIMKHVNMFNLN